MDHAALAVEHYEDGKAEALRMAQAAHQGLGARVLGLARMVVDVDEEEMVVDDLGNVGFGGGEVGKAQAPRTPVAPHLADDQLGLLAASRRGQRAVYLLHRVDGLVVHFLQRGLGVAHYDGGADQEEGKDQSLHILTCC